MRETQIYEYFAFGYNYHLLKAMVAGRLLRGDGDSLEGMINAFLETIENLGLVVTRHASSELGVILEEARGASENSRADASLAKRVAAACDRLDATLDAELALRTAFVVTPKRFDLRHLLQEPWQLLGEEAIDRLPKLAKFDFASGCRCIAYNLPTAAAFHFMRCLEGMLRHYYREIIKRNRVSPLLWYPMIEHLRKVRKPLPKPLLDHLDHIRSNFRNPTQHPDARYELEEAQDLLAVSIDALNRMARDLAKRAA